jgi:hypothetical protein
MRKPFASVATLALFACLFALPLRAAGQSTVLMVTKAGKDFESVSKGLRDEMPKHKFEQLVVSASTTVADLTKAIRTHKPRMMFLLDNQSVELAKQHYSANPNDKTQSVALMALNLRKIVQGQPNICAVAYEVPIYTLVTQLRFAVQGRRINRVVTFYRGSQFQEMIDLESQRLKGEGIELVAVDVEKAAKGDLDGYLQSEGGKLLKDTHRAETFLVLLDSVLLSKELFAKFWINQAAENRILFTAGFEGFVNPAMNFAVFGMSPNLQDLVSQSRQMAESVIEGQPCSKLGVEDLLGVNKFWNERKAKALRLTLNPQARGSLQVLE